MKAILLASACALAMTTFASAQSNLGGSSAQTVTPNSRGGTTVGVDATKDTTNADRQTIPGNTAAGGSNPSSPKSNQPGASKAGGG